MPTDEHAVRQVCLSAFRELGLPGPLRGRTPSIWQTAGPSLFPTPSSPDCGGHPPRGTHPPAGGPPPPPPRPPPPPPPAPPMLRVYQLLHAAVGDRYEVADFLAAVDLPRTRDLGVGVLQHFLPLRQPADGARNAEQHGELVRRETHRLVDDARVEIHVRVELASA